MEDWALIRRLSADGLPKAQIAAKLGLSRNTVAKAVAAAGPPKYERAPVTTAFTPFEARVRALLAEYPQLPATVIAERVGWAGSNSWFRDNVRRLRQEYLPRDPADRLVHVAGDQAQCDLWFPPARVPLGPRTSTPPPVLVIVAAFSRFITARMIPSRATPDLLAGMWSLLASQLQAVPRRLIWDNEAGIGRRGRLADGVSGFTGALGARIVQLKPFDPESKGVVERANGYLETSFLPGRAFTCPGDFNEQLARWLPRANSRVVRSLHERPQDRIAADRAAMLGLPPIPPPVGWSQRVRLGRDYYVSVAGSDYSVDPTVIGQLVSVHADLDTVVVTVPGRRVATHPRSWTSATTVTDPAHVEQAARLRKVFQTPRPAAADDLVRDLADYDRAFGVQVGADQPAQVAS